MIAAWPLALTVAPVFVKGTERPVAHADAAIASIARRVWDYWGPPSAR